MEYWIKCLTKHPVATTWYIPKIALSALKVMVSETELCEIERKNRLTRYYTKEEPDLQEYIHNLNKKKHLITQLISYTKKYFDIVDPERKEEVTLEPRNQLKTIEDTLTELTQ